MTSSKDLLFQLIQDTMIKTGFKTLEEVFHEVKTHPLILISCCHSSEEEENENSPCRLSVISDNTLTGNYKELCEKIQQLVSTYCIPEHRKVQ